ncbi:hypothetical protein AHMF7616_05008 [Adhaeribacter pallidiroseus]|uniref:Lipocalin-like domain-containing protein n=2 Tax=Adhaeribacter pallidiroseus TaxID=2072847 RepID=A0A369QT43_9BACT|nr:hypothetical protein AHMF7616_05008 [Adhaeribacter pallidiroseus]
MVSCSKDNDISHKFTGKWEYERYIGYPFTDTALPPGNGQTITLTNNGIFESRKQDTVLFVGKYTIKQRKDCYKRDNTWLLSTDDPYFKEVYINIENNKLTLSQPNCYADGGIIYYRRLK